MIIREALPTDAEKLIHLMKQVEQSNFMLFEPGERKTTPEQFQKWIAELGEESKIFVAEERQELLGYLFAIAEGVKRKSHSVYVAVGIKEGQRGKGIGTQLFEALDAWALAKKLRRLELTVMEDNGAGLALYKKMGFEVEGVKRDSLVIDGKFINEFYMSKIFL